MYLGIYVLCFVRLIAHCDDGFLAAPVDLDAQRAVQMHQTHVLGLHLGGQLLDDVFAPEAVAAESVDGQIAHTE